MEGHLSARSLGGTTRQRIESTVYIIFATYVHLTTVLRTEKRVVLKGAIARAPRMYSVHALRVI